MTQAGAAAAAIAARHDDQCTALARTFTYHTDRTEPGAIRAGLTSLLGALAEVFRAEASAITAAKKASHVSQSREWHKAAQFIAGYELRLRTVFIDDGDHERRAPLADVPENRGMVHVADLKPQPTQPTLSLPGEAELGPSYGPGDPVPAWAMARSETGETLTVTPADTISAHALDIAGATTPERQAAIKEHIAAIPVVDPFSDPVPVGTDASADPFVNPTGVGTRPRMTMIETVALFDQLKADPPKTVSNSRVEALRDCGFKAAFQRAERRKLTPPGRPQWALIGGNAFHSAVEALERMVPAAGDTYTPPTDDGITSAWEHYLRTEIDETLAALGGAWTEDEIRPSARGKEGFDWWRVEGADMLRRYVAHHGEEYRKAHSTLVLPGGIPCIELEFLHQVADPSTGETLELHGFIDRVGIDIAPNAGIMLRLVDYKTGASTGSMFQRAYYTHVFRQAYIIPAGWSILSANWDARKGEYTEWVDPTIRYPWELIMRELSVTNVTHRLGLFLPNPGPFCSACPFESLCPARGGM